MNMMLARAARGERNDGSAVVPVRQPVALAEPQVRFALPATALRGLITSYYQVVAPAPLEDFLHPEWGNIRFSTRGQWSLSRPGCNDPTPERTSLFGPTDRTGMVRTPGDAASVGIGLTALGWVMLIGEPADRHANRVCDLGQVYGAAAEHLWQQLRTADWAASVALLDGFFTAKAAAAPPPDPMIALVEAALVDGNIDTAHDFAASLGLNERTLARLCQRVFGFAPKRLLRRQRFLRTLADIGDRLDQPLAALLDGSYFDQSHFNREFKAYMGMTPLAYFHSPRQMMRRAAAERLRTMGAMVQGLHHAKAD
jgi:methylphosphotriester-DNA--protein-cysteine methyltransferase